MLFYYDTKDKNIISGFIHVVLLAWVVLLAFIKIKCFNSTLVSLTI